MDRISSAASRSVAGDEAMGGVAEEFGGRVSQPEGEDGARGRVDRGPYDGVHPARCHGLDDGLELGGLAEQVGQLAVGPAQRGLVGKVQPDAAEVGAVTQVGAVVLSATG